MSMRLGILGVVLLIVVTVLWNSIFTIDEREQALVLQFGEPVRTIAEPGLNFKLPFVQTVSFFERRVVPVDPPVEPVLLADQRRLDVDTFVRYRIADPLLYFQTVRDELTAVQRVSTVTNSATREVIGNATQPEILSEERIVLMERIRDQVQRRVEAFGIEIVDVRIGRADVPEGTIQSVYDRMRSEREREAAEFRAQGEEQAQQIRSRADRERTVLLAEAEREAQILRGQGDAEAIVIQAEAFNQNPEFYAFYRTLQAYRTSMANQETTLVLSPEGDFFRFFQDITGGVAPLPVPAEPPTAAGTAPPAEEATEVEPQAETSSLVPLPSAPAGTGPTAAAALR